MSGPKYTGYIVERWAPERLKDVKRRVAQALLDAGNEGQPGDYALVIAVEAGAAWISIQDSYGGEDGVSLSGVLEALTAATGSPIWEYEYCSRSSFYINAYRYLADGSCGVEIEVGESDEPPRKLANKDGFDFTAWCEDRVSSKILKTVKWKAEDLRTAPTDEGPALLNRCKTRRHPLKESFRGLKRPAPAPPPLPLPTPAPTGEPFIGFVLEDWKPKRLPALLQAVADAVWDAGYRKAFEEFEAHVYVVEGAAWLVVMCTTCKHFKWLPWKMKDVAAVANAAVSSVWFCESWWTEDGRPSLSGLRLSVEEDPRRHDHAEKEILRRVPWKPADLAISDVDQKVPDLSRRVPAKVLKLAPLLQRRAEGA